MVLDAAMETDPILRYKKVASVFEDLLADRSRLLPVVVDLFIGTIGKPEAKHAFKAAFDYSTTTPIGLETLKQIEDIPCLIIWGEQDSLIHMDHINQFHKVFRKKEDRFEVIKDSGHAPFAEKTALVYEKIRTFLVVEEERKNSRID
jgi:pimeloyl-ACP methyl ester carboxylesterase